MAIRNYDKITERELADGVDRKLNYLENKKLSENITVKGECHGTFDDGEIITKGTRVHDIIKGMLDDTYEFPYRFPTLKLIGVEENIEVGNVIDMTLIPEFNQNDAGSLTRFRLEKSVSGGEFVLLYDTDHLVSHNEYSVSITDSENILSFRATVWFEEGKVKYQNGESIQGHVEAGSVSSILTISGIRKCFYGAESGIKFPVENSNQVRNLPNFTVFESDGGIIEMEIPAGTSRITLAYPAYVRNVQSIISKKLGYDIKEVFEESTVRVNGINGYSDIAYKVYTYIPDANYPSDDTYTFYIADGTKMETPGNESLISVIEMSEKLSGMEQKMLRALYVD